MVIFLASFALYTASHLDEGSASCCTLRVAACTTCVVSCAFCSDWKRLTAFRTMRTASRMAPWSCPRYEAICDEKGDSLFRPFFCSYSLLSLQTWEPQRAALVLSRRGCDGGFMRTRAWRPRIKSRGYATPPSSLQFGTRDLCIIQRKSLQHHSTISTPLKWEHYAF